MMFFLNKIIQQLLSIGKSHIPSQRNVIEEVLAAVYSSHPMRAQNILVCKKSILIGRKEYTVAGTSCIMFLCVYDTKSCQYLDVNQGFCGHVVNISIIKSQLIWHPRLSTAVHKVVLKESKTYWLHVIHACKNLNTVH